MRVCILLVFSFLSLNVFADNCVPVKPKMHDKNMVFSYAGEKDSGQVYFFHNTSTQGIWMDHPSNHAMNAGWSSYVRAGNWSAFLLNRKNFEISCATIQPGQVNYLDCSKIISVCSPSNSSFKAPVKGSFWLAEDKSWDELMKIVSKRGVSLS